jgi:hypothetical protein
VTIEEIRDGEVTWRFDTAFLTSRWTCIWGRGCLGIHDVPTPELGEGCCSIGAELGDEDEAMLISALAAMLGPEVFEHHADALDIGIFSDDTRRATRVVDGACIFFNRPGFAGGGGCALHLKALTAGESPTEWKPSVCWQLPIKVDWSPDPDDAAREIAVVRGWTRADWGDDGEKMAWCCTEGELAYVGERPVIESMGETLDALVGTAVYVELRRRLA